MNDVSPETEGIRERQHWMAVLAKSTTDAIESVWEEVPDKPSWACIRPPESGMVMVRARAGGTGQRFHMGEMTVTRCVVRLDAGEVGHAYVAGRDSRHAELAAVIDALLQQPGRRSEMHRLVVEPLESAQSEERDRTARRTAATKVDFFTMVRGE